MLSAVATVLLVPPVNLVFLALAGLAIARRRPAVGRRIVLVSLAALLLLALPAVADPLLLGLERGLNAPGPAPAAQAIVILGGNAAEVGARADRAEVGWLTLERLRGGAALARSTGLPVLVTGGVVTATGPPVAVLMAQSLADDFGVRVRWVEPRSATTWQNAAFSAAMLRRDGISTVLLVTHAWHMRRALIAFRAAGLTAIPAPLPWAGRWHPTWGSLVPRVSAWQNSYFALHEWIGCAWYALRAALARPG